MDDDVTDVLILYARSSPSSFDAGLRARVARSVRTRPLQTAADLLATVGDRDWRSAG